MTVIVTLSTSVVVTVRREHDGSAAGVAWCLMATGVTGTVSYTYLVEVNVFALHADSARERLARGARLKMEDFMASVQRCGDGKTRGVDDLRQTWMLKLKENGCSAMACENE